MCFHAAAKHAQLFEILAAHEHVDVPLLAGEELMRQIVQDEEVCEPRLAAEKQEPPLQLCLVPTEAATLAH